MRLELLPSPIDSLVGRSDNVALRSSSSLLIMMIVVVVVEPIRVESSRVGALLLSSEHNAAIATRGVIFPPARGNRFSALSLSACDDDSTL